MSNAPTPASEKAWAALSSQVAVLIAIMSAVSAFAGWRASLAEIDAADLGRRLIQERMLVEATTLQLDTKVYRDQSLFARYQEHVAAEYLLQLDVHNAAQRARQYQELDPGGSAGRDEADLAAALDMQAQGEQALARSLTPFFRVRTPQLTSKPDVVAYHADAARRAALASDTTLRTIHPDETEVALEQLHRRTWRLFGVAAIFVISVFLLTLAEFGPPPARPTLAYAGVVVIACGIVAWALAEAPFL